MKQKNLALIIHIWRSFLFFFLLFMFSNGSTINVVNQCGFTVWPGLYSSHDLNISGFELTTGNSRSFQTPSNWRGSLWGRTGCTFNGTGHGLCKTGDCGSGEMECNGRTPTPPVTVASFDFEEGISEFYNINVKNGYNLQMSVEPTSMSANVSQDCLKTGCVYDLNKRCPKELRLEGGGGCNTPCQVFGTPQQSCGSLDNSSIMCKSTPYTQLFNFACPISHLESGSYVNYCYDTRQIFTVQFCPPQIKYRAVSTMRGGELLNYDIMYILVEWVKIYFQCFKAWELWRQGNAMEFEDPTLRSTCVGQQFLRFLHVALLCVQQSAVDRPMTSDMISMLLNDTILLPSPKRSAFFTHITESNSTLDQIKPEDCSLNNTTMSAILEGR